MMLAYRFVESGGYDSMSDAFYIEDAGRPELDRWRLITAVDMRDFQGKTPSEVELIVRDLVDGFNAITLVRENNAESPVVNLFNADDEEDTHL